MIALRPARVLPLAAVACLVAVASAAGQHTPVHYSVSPVMEGDSLTALAVEIRFDGDADGETRLSLPREWAGTDSLWRSVRALEVQGAASVTEDGPAARIIRHRPQAELTVRYHVVSAYEREPGLAYQKALPLILPRWFFFHGEGVFATPDGRDGAQGRFAWKGFPRTWKLASDLDHVADGTRIGSVADVRESVAIGAPDLRVLARAAEGSSLRLAMRGEWSFTPEELARAVHAIVDTQDRSWGSFPRAFVVPLAPVGAGEGGGYSMQGSGRLDAFSLASTTNVPFAEVRWLLAHEYLHTWIPGQLGGLPEKDEAHDYWFSEGFTDFAAARALVRAGLWTPAEFVADLNARLLRYATSPARGTTAAAWTERFWRDAQVRQNVYDHGHVLALSLDARIRRATGGRKELHDVLLAQHAAARRNEGEGARVTAVPLFATVLRGETGIDLADDLARHVERGEPVLLPTDAFGSCAAVSTVTQPVFDRGWSAEATSAADGVIAGVDPAGPAFAAGMRDGMRFVRREAGTIGDSSVEVVYRVMDGATERVIRYRPEGKDRVTLQRVALAPGAPTAACVRRLGGAR